MQCRTCQAEMPQGATVCPSCQAPVQAMPAPSEYIAFPEVPPDAPASVIPPQGPYTLPPQGPGAPISTVPPQGPIVMPPPYPPYPPYAPMPFPPPQPQKKRKTWLIVTLSILGVVVILGSCGFICTLAMQGVMNQTQRQMQTIQATVNTQGTQSVSAQSLYTEVTNRAPTFSNALASKGKGDWIDVGSDSTYSCGFKDGTYHVFMDEKGYMANCYFDRFYMDFAIQIEVNLLKGDDVGMLFRSDPSGNNYYQFEYNQQGLYSLYKGADNSNSRDTLTEGFASPYLNAEYGQKNVVTIIARGPSIYLYVNQHFLAQVQDGSYTSGHIALIADETDKPTEAAFSNVKIWEL